MSDENCRRSFTSAGEKKKHPCVELQHSDMEMRMRYSRMSLQQQDFQLNYTAAVELVYDHHHHIYRGMSLNLCSVYWRHPETSSKVKSTPGQINVWSYLEEFSVQQ